MLGLLGEDGRELSVSVVEQPVMVVRAQAPIAVATVIFLLSALMLGAAFP
ncbi:hypothetical protein ACFZAT_08220 [Streptomyces sp. NPDC008163]